MSLFPLKSRRSARRGGVNRVAAAAVFVLAITGAWAIFTQREESFAAFDADVEQVWGSPGTQPGQLHRPRAAQPLADGSILVIDRSGRAQRFSIDGEPLGAWTFPDWSQGTPTGVCLLEDGRLVVADTHYSRILIYDPITGELLDQFGEHGPEPGQLQLPTDVAQTPDGVLHIVERGPWLDRVSRFTVDGEFLDTYCEYGDGPGQLQRAMAIVCDPRGRLWVADAGNHRLNVYDAEGSFLFDVGEPGDGVGRLYYPYDLAVAAEGEIIVAEYGNNRLQVFSPDGESFGIIGGPGTGPGHFASPWGVAVDDEGRIWIADTLNHRVQALAAEKGAWKMANGG